MENFQYTVGSREGAFTDLIPWWRSISHGMILFPVEIFMIVTLLVWMLKAAAGSGWGITKSPLNKAFAVLWVLLVIALGIGLSHGAQLKYALWELRTFMYLTAAYLLANALLRTRRALYAIAWTIVVGTGFKSLQGTYIYFAYARDMTPRPQEILGHEEALFFTIFIILTAALWLYQQRGRLRTTATCLLPFVIIADLANARRTAWLDLFLGLATLGIISWVTLPNRRRVLSRTLCATLCLSAVYFPAYWNHSGTLAQPARAVRSQFDPSQRDESSDVYRQEEDVNLLLNIQSSGPLGRGFGVPIVYSVSIADIEALDPLIVYVPHDGILWIWLRIGLQGEIVFWSLIAIGIIRSSRLAKSSDPQLALLGALVASSIVPYLARDT